MKFNYTCDGIDGLVLIDESSLCELDGALLYGLDILLDRYGQSELVFDFPNEIWDDVRRRETKEIIDFCNSGKMVIVLRCEDEEDCTIIMTDSPQNPMAFIAVKTGKLILVNASELVQCLAHPELKMETLLKLDSLEPGMYSVTFNGFRSISLSKSELSAKVNNVIEL